MIVWNGKIDIVIEMRMKEWHARAFGVSIGETFFGVIRFTKKPVAANAKERADEFHFRPSDVTVLKRDDGFWLSVDGRKKALINLGEHGPIVTAALEEAAEPDITEGSEA
jgi:hypothetical protein